MMRIYLTVYGDSFWGPMDRDLAWKKIQSGEIPKSAKWIEDRGQSLVGLRSEFAFCRPLGDIWGDKLDEVPDDLERPASSDALLGLSPPPPASGITYPPPGVGLLSLLGPLWLFLTLVGAAMIVWEYGKVEIVAWAIAITGVMQGLVVYAVCRVLADVRIRLERLVEAK